MKINLVKKSVLALAMALSLASCANNGAADTAEKPAVADQTEVSTDESKVANKEVENEENKAETTIDVKASETTDTEANNENETGASMADGSYVTTLMSEANGERDPEFSFATAYDAKASENSLVVSASLDYRANPDDYDNVEELANDTYEFTTNADTVYQAVGGLAEPTYYSPAEFTDFYNEVKDSGLGLIIEVENGIVKTVSVSS